jgi:hypothetical protein
LRKNISIISELAPLKEIYLKVDRLTCKVKNGADYDEIGEEHNL